MHSGGTSGRRIHQTRNRTAHASEPRRNPKNHCNSLKNFPLHGFNKHPHWFRCSGKGEHLNLATRQNPAANQLTTNALQEVQQPRPWFRSLAGQECRGMQMCPEGASGRGIHQTRSRVANASEPRQSPKKSPQLIDKPSIARFQQASSLVQMQSGRKKAKNHFSSRYNTLDICASLTCHFSLSSYAIFILSLSDNST